MKNLAMTPLNLRLYKYFCVAIFCLIALGGSVRAMKAGLACPDWPLCFGQIIPNYQPQVYFEFIHRVVAGLVSLSALYLNFCVMRDRQVAGSVKWVAGGSLFLLMAQIVMGGLTVILQLHDKIVAAHLALGTGFFSLSLWAYLSMTAEQYAKENVATKSESLPTLTKRLTLVLVACVYSQILLGGLVASNYAALVCTDFPLCHGQFIPTLSGIIGLHVIHRLGAYTLAIVVTSYATYILKTTDHIEMRKWAKVLLGLLALQICVGIANVKFLTPPLITVLHLAVGVSVLATAIRLLRLATLAPEMAAAKASEKLYQPSGSEPLLTQ